MKLKRWKSTIFAIALMVGLFIADSAENCPAAQTGGSEGQRVTFQWAFGAIQNDEDDARFTSIKRDAVLKSGDRIKFYLKLVESCHIYLIYYSAQGELNILFPYRFEASDTDVAGNDRHYIPEGENWFHLDENRGKEKFYLLASAKPLTTLELLLNAYESADSNGQSDLAPKILAEIRKIRKQHIKFKARAERPVNIVGNMRGNVKERNSNSLDIATHAVEISADTFFSRTFTIDHQ